jgi:poly(3-hydroxyalkanoate) depolymerase
MVPPERGTRTRAGEAVKRPPEISFPRLMGQVLRTAIWRADKPTGKRPVLFFNRIGANLELVQPLGEKLDDRDIVTFDVPGVGESPDPDFPYRPWQMARLARKVLDYYGIDDVDVMGVSWGGGLAQQFAFQYRNRVGRVVLAATTTGFTMVPGKFEALSKMASPERYADPDFMRKNFEALYGDGEEHASGHASGLKPPSMKGYIFQMLAMAGWTSIPFLGQIKQPVLILAGDRDNIVPQINAKIIDTFLPNGRVHIVEGGGHLFLVSKADEVLPIIREFYDA